jgi:hypothetical protein
MKKLIGALVTYANVPESETIMNIIITGFIIKNVCLWNPRKPSAEAQGSTNDMQH